MGLEEHTVESRGKQRGYTIGELKILGWIRATPRWADEPVRRLGMLGQIRAMPRWK